MRFGSHQVEQPIVVRALVETPPERALLDWEAPFPEFPEQRFAYCMKMMSVILCTSGPLQGVYAKRLMKLLVETFDYDGPHWLMPLSNETYWQVQVMRMWRPYGVLHRMTQYWAKEEFCQWTSLARSFVF